MRLTFAVENFFSVPVTAPLRCAALRALLPLMVVSRSAAPGPRTLLPILVTEFQSSLMVDTWMVCREVDMSGIARCVGDEERGLVKA